MPPPRLMRAGFLTGLSKLEQDHLPRDMGAKALSERSEADRQLEKDAEHLRRAGQLLIAYQLKCADQNIVVAAKVSANAAQAATAAASPGNGRFCAEINARSALLGDIGVKSTANEMARVENTNFSNMVRRMLGLGLDTWYAIMEVFLFAAAVVAGGVGVSTYATIQLQKKEAQDTAIKIAEANLRASAANERAATLEKEGAQLRVDLGKARAQAAFRPWTRQQFDAIQEIKGVVTDVGIVVKKGCIECLSFSTHIELALHEADVHLYGDIEGYDMEWMGVQVYIPPPSDIIAHPLIKVLTKAGLDPVGTSYIDSSHFKSDIPVIMIGDKPMEMISVPFQPSHPSSWTKLPLRR
jgi:hypothetical protein